MNFEDLPVVDPRVAQVPFGSMETVTEIGPNAIRIVAPNASPMTLDGTNTYLLVGDKLSTFIVDPGPSTLEHLLEVKGVIEKKGLDPRGILLTHGHFDHSEATKAFGLEFEVPVYGNGHLDDLEMIHLSDNDSIELDSSKVIALGTPGHTGDHLCFLLPDGELLTGDHILGRGTSVVAAPDGDLESYIGSLIKVYDLDRRHLLPGHGPDLTSEISKEVVGYYLSHRMLRLKQVLFSFDENPKDVKDVVRGIYGDSVPESLFFAAELSTRASVVALLEGGHLRAVGSGGYIRNEASDFDMTLFLKG